MTCDNGETYSIGSLIFEYPNPLISSIFSGTLTKYSLNSTNGTDIE